MKQVRIADLKARLSEHLRAVQRGDSVVVLDRNQPIARIVPYGAGTGSLRIRKPARKTPRLRQVKLPPPLSIRSDIVKLLMEDRESGA